MLTWRATRSRRRRRRRWSSRRRRRRRQQPAARPSRTRAVTLGAAPAAAAAPARMKTEKYSSRPEVEGVARLDPTSLSVVSHFFACTFLTWTIRFWFQCCHFLMPHVPLHLASTEWWINKISFNLDFFLKTSKISILFIMISEVHNRTMSPAVEVSSLRSVRPFFLFLSGIVVVGLLDIKVSRLEQENEALLWAKCIQLLWHWWFLVVSFLSKFFFLLCFPAFLSEQLFRQTTSFGERLCALFTSVSQKWKVRWARHSSSFWDLSFIFQMEAWGQLSYGIKNVAMDIKISCGTRVATGLADCLILENKIVSLWLT